MKIIADENIPFVQAAFSTIGQVVTLPGRLIQQTDLIDCQLLLVRSVTKVNRPLLSGTKVQFVASATSGINHINLDDLNALDIGFAHAPGSNATSVAEYVMSAVAHWSLLKDKAIQGLSIGIIGGGQVGTQVEGLCQKMGMKTVVNDPPLAQQYPSDRFASLEAALGCDVISLHVPLTHTGKHATLNLINQRLIQQIKPDTLLINSARGEVIDEAALLSRQKNQQDLDLVLDVWQNEPNINLELLAHTLIGTPHVAGYSYDGKIRGTHMIYQACCQFLNTQPQWSEACVVENTHPNAVNVINKGADIRRSILGAYDLSKDNGRLKQLLTDQKIPVGIYFDRLRKTYPKRREWSLSFDDLLQP